MHLSWQLPAFKFPTDLNGWLVECSQVGGGLAWLLTQHHCLQQQPASTAASARAAGEGRNQSKPQHSARGHKTFHCTTSHQISYHHSTPPRTMALGGSHPLKAFPAVQIPPPTVQPSPQPAAAESLPPCAPAGGRKHANSLHTMCRRSRPGPCPPTQHQQHPVLHAAAAVLVFTCPCSVPY